MSIYNRKMFNRNARNALNRTAGIPNVAMFHAGGPVGHTHNIRRVGGNTSPLSMSPIEAAALQEYRAKQSPQPNIGNLLTLRGGVSGVVSDAVGPRSSKLGTRLLQDAATYGTNIFVDAPMAAGAGLASLFARRKDKGAGTVGAPMRLAGGVVDQINTGKLPEDLSGVDITTIPGVGVGTSPPVPAGTAPGTPIKIGAPGDKTRQPPTDPFSPQFPIAFGQPVTDMAQIATADAGMQTDTAPMGRLQDEETRKRILAEETRMQQGQTDPAELTQDQKDAILTEETRMQQGQTSSEDSADLDEADNQTAAIVAQARQANSAAGVPKLETATDELDAAMQAGTQSPEDIKAEFLKLLPKYEQDPSIDGLNLAMMGFMIAGGESPHALKNIADGMKKGLPAFIKSKEKRKAFEREVDLLASKYTIGRLEEDRKAERQNNTYFASQAFENPITGEKVEAGQIFRLNDKAFRIAEQQGLTKFLTSEAAFGKQITANAAIEKARLAANNTSLNDFYEKSTDVEIGGQKIRVRFPSATGEAAGMVARPSGGQAAWDAFTTGYAENLDQIRFADKGVQSGIDLLDKGEALGTSGLVGKIVDATKAVVPEKYGKALGIDYNTLSDANQFEVVQRSLALQLAPVLLQESGKTISDADRARVAAALGFKVDQQGNILFDNGIVNAFKTEEEARRSLMEVQRVLRRNATKLHAEYGKAAKLFGMQGLPSESKGQAGFVVKEGGEGDEFDLEIIAG